MPERTTNAEEYAYGFNGKLNDNEVYGSNGTFQDYGFRMYDTRIARFISADPLIVYGQQYPELSSYQFASNTPIMGIDLDGLELSVSIDGSILSGPVNLQVINAKAVEKNVSLLSAANVLKVNQIIIDNSINQPLYPMPKRQTKITSNNDPLIEFTATTEAGLVLGAKAKILGIGGEAKFGVTQPITTAVFSDKKIETAVGGEPQVTASIGSGPVAIGASKSLSSMKGEVYGNVGPVEGNVNTNADFNSRITVFDFGLTILGGGTLKLTLSNDIFSSSGIPNPPNKTSDALPDKTNVNLINVPRYQK